MSLNLDSIMAKHTDITTLEKELRKEKPYYEKCKSHFQSLCSIVKNDSEPYLKAKRLLHSISCKYHTHLAQLKKLDPTHELVKDLPEKRKHKVDHKHVFEETKKGLDTVIGIYHNDEACSSSGIPENVVVLARSRRKILVSVAKSMLSNYLEQLSKKDENFVFTNDEKKRKKRHDHKVHKTNGINDILGTGLENGNIFNNVLGKLHMLCDSGNGKIPVYCNRLVIRETLTENEYKRWRTICRNFVMHRQLDHLPDNPKIVYCSDTNCIMSNMGFITNENTRPFYTHDHVIRWRDILIECPICKKSIKNQTDIEQQTTQMLNEVTRKCPRCKTPAMRESGCYHMVCPNCHSDWCWNCGELRNPRDPDGHQCPIELQDDVSRMYDHPPQEEWIDGLPPLTEEEMRLNGIEPEEPEEQE